MHHYECIQRHSHPTVSGEPTYRRRLVYGWRSLILGQWRRSVVKYGGTLIQVKPSNCFRRLEKLVLPSVFDTKSFIIDDVKLAELSNNSFDWKKGDILRGRTYSNPSYLFSGDQDPQPQDLRSCPGLDGSSPRKRGPDGWRLAAGARHRMHWGNISGL